MATARKHWFKVADSILHEPWPRDVKLTCVLLSAWLNRRWARDGLTYEEAAKATLSRAHLAEITGRVQVGHALGALRALGEFISLSIRSQGEFTEIHWPKWAEFQEPASRDGATRTPRREPSMPPPQPQPQKKKKREREPDPAAAEPASSTPGDQSFGTGEKVTAQAKRKTPRCPIPPGFPGAEFRAELVKDFPDVDVGQAIASFLDFARGEGRSYRGELGWSMALRGSIRRGRAAGYFVRKAGNSPTDAGPRKAVDVSAVDRARARVQEETQDDRDAAVRDAQGLRFRCRGAAA